MDTGALLHYDQISESTGMTTMTEDHVDLDTRQEALTRRVLLLCPTIGWWKGMYQLPRTSTETTSDGKTVDKDDITTPRAKLMTDVYPVDISGTPWKRRFQKLESRLSALKERFSVPFPIQGVRIVPKTRGQELLDEMYGLTLGRLRQRIRKAYDAGQDGVINVLERQLAEALRREGENALPNTPIYDPTRPSDGQSIAYDLHRASVEFCNDWDRIREQIRSKNDVFSQVESKVPTSAGVMLTKFHLDVVPVELAGGGTGHHEVDEDDLVAHNDVVREACRRRVDEAIETMISGPRQQLADALTSLNDLVSRDGRVSQKTFRPIREAIAKIRLFDFAANPQLLKRIGELEHRLSITTPDSLDAMTAANNGFTAAIVGFMNEVQDSEAMARDLEEFGREGRSIDFS